MKSVILGVILYFLGYSILVFGFGFDAGAVLGGYILGLIMSLIK